jgi:hypothetical protein
MLQTWEEWVVSLCVPWALCSVVETGHMYIHKASNITKYMIANHIFRFFHGTHIFIKSLLVVPCSIYYVYTCTYLVNNSFVFLGINELKSLFTISNFLEQDMHISYGILHTIHNTVQKAYALFYKYFYMRIRILKSERCSRCLTVPMSK